MVDWVSCQQHEIKVWCITLLLIKKDYALKWW
jgi:hypothetical protein